jgi:hypothetical protein
MNHLPKRISVGMLAALLTLLALLVGSGGIGSAGATSGARDTSITDAVLDKARAAALASIGEGQVTALEVDDEDGAYEVEITRADGSQVDVHLDEHFNVLSQYADAADPDDAAGPNDD